MISVVVALYNGERYLIPQLNSIYQQTLQPDEVLLFDDCSTDLTYKITELFISGHKLTTNWILKRNTTNLGWRRNFYELIKAAKGDIIFFSDQDDIWDDHKIELMYQAIKENNIEILACNYAMIFEKTGAKWKGMKAFFAPYGTKNLEQVKMDKWWLGSLRSGSTVAITAPIKNIFLNTWQEGMVHDGLVEAIGIARGSFYILNKVLVTHRMHDKNNTPHYRHTKEEQLKGLEAAYNMGRAVKGAQNLKASEEKMLFMNKMLHFLERRMKAIKKKNFIEFMRLLEYLNLYPRYRTWVADVISSFR